MTEFKSWNSYWDFARSVRKHSRYIRKDEVEEFLSAVTATAKSRAQRLPKGTRLWRAQIGYDELPIVHPDYDEIVDYEKVPLPRDRMKPLVERAKEGRVNPKGIPCLYLASNKKTAMSEVRPWIGLHISIGEFEILRDLRIINCTLDLEKKSLFFPVLKNLPDHPFDVVEPDVSPEEREGAVWAHINKALSEPVTPNDSIADYVPTQIIAELFKQQGYDGIAYKSSVVKGPKKSYNIALFDLDVAEMRGSRVFKVKTIQYTFDDARHF